MPRLEVRDLTVEYTANGYVVRPLDAVSLAAQDGELVLLLGPSGCGKTTLLSCLGGILSPTGGSIDLDGRRVDGLNGKELTRYRSGSVGIVFQTFNLIASLTAAENVAVPLLGTRFSHREAMHRARALLHLVGLGDRVTHRPGQLSGGQQQRVAIARALVLDPPLILADEPTANLDHIQAESVIRTLRGLASAGRIIIVSTHDDRFRAIADRVVDLSPDAVQADVPARRITVAQGDVVFRQGDRSDLIYVVDSGRVAVVREHADGSEEVLAEIEGGGYFGELGPMLRYPRSATARAVTAVELTAYGVREFRERFGAPV